MNSFYVVIIILLFVWTDFVVIVLVSLCNPILVLYFLVTLRARNDHNHYHILYTSQQYIIGSIFKAVQHWLRKNLASIRYKIGKKKKYRVDKLIR